MTQTTIDLIVGCVTFFLTALSNVAILGFFLGGVKSDIMALRREVAEIKGAFTLIPRGGNVESNKSVLSVGMDRVGGTVRNL